MDITQAPKEGIPMRREDNIPGLPRQSGAIEVPHAPIEDFVISPLKHHGGKAELWNLHPSDQAALTEGGLCRSNRGRLCVLTRRLILQNAVELLIPSMLLNARVQPLRTAVPENHEPGRKQQAFE
jgi:hypothetical protein